MSVKEAVQSSAAWEYISVSCKYQGPNTISVELCFAEGAHLSSGALPDRCFKQLGVLLSSVSSLTSSLTTFEENNNVETIKGDG